MLKIYLQTILTLCLLVVALVVGRWYGRRGSIADGVSPESEQRLGTLTSLSMGTRNPDTTAVVLNWSRFPNVQRISSLLCSPLLDEVISKVFVWNNSPNKISYEDFTDTACPRSKLKIHNSPENLYFQARFLACAQSDTTYCFIQDDDYLVLPEVVHTLHAQIRKSRNPHSIHLLPPHEHLSSSLRETLVRNNESPPRSIHTGFAWLGHGAILHRTEVVDFLALLHALNVSDEEMKMADNYYAILKNRVPEIWFDQGIELGGGQPFTVGVGGNERNKRHIVQATGYLESVLSVEPTHDATFPYVRTFDRSDCEDVALTRAACRDARCLLESNIAMLPGTLERATDSATNMLELEARNREVVNASGNATYLNHPPSMAIDNRPGTYFESPEGAKMGDFIQLNFFDDLRILQRGSSGVLETVWLVDSHTERILRSSQVSTLSDGHTQCAQATRSEVVCNDDVQANGETLRECVFALRFDESERRPPPCVSGHIVRLEVVRAVEPPAVPWRVHEVWVRERARLNDQA